MKRPKYLFKKEYKVEFLKGRSLVYLSRVLDISYSHMTSIIQGRHKVDDFSIGEIIKAIGYNENEVEKLKAKFFDLV